MAFENIEPKPKQKLQPILKTKFRLFRGVRPHTQMRRLFGGTIIALGCICTGSSSSSGGNGLNGGSKYPGRPARGRSKSQTSQASRFNSGLSRGGGESSSSLPSDDLLDFLDGDIESTTTGNSYDASFFDDGNYGLDVDSDGHASESLGDSDMGGGYELDDDVSEEEDFGQGSEKGALYDAYNLLHSLAQVS